MTLNTLWRGDCNLGKKNTNFSINDQELPSVPKYPTVPDRKMNFKSFLQVRKD